MSAAANRVALDGTIVALGALRHTPAGVPVLEFSIQHQSEIREAGVLRSVNAQVDAVAFESLARLIAGSAMGRPVRVAGFLAAKSKRSRKLVLHVTNIEFIEGD